MHNIYLIMLKNILIRVKIIHKKTVYPNLTKSGTLENIYFRPSKISLIDASSVEHI